MEFFILYWITFHCPPPVQTPRRQEVTGEFSDHLRESPKSTSRVKCIGTRMKKTVDNGLSQGANHEFSEHSLVSPDPMRNIRDFHIQQRKSHLQNEVRRTDETQFHSPRPHEPQEPNLISFTPLQGQQHVTEKKDDKQKKQRSPRRRRSTRNDGQPNQRQVEQNMEISHISPGGQVNVFNTEEPSISYLQLPTRMAQENNKVCTKCGEMGHWKRYCRNMTWCKFCTSETHATQACRRYANFVRDNPIASSRRMTPVQEQRSSEINRPNVPVGQKSQYEMERNQLFPHPPTQHFRPPEIPPVATGQKWLRGSSQDVSRDPHF